MTRILFVDDDPRVLDGIGRALHCMRHEWDLRFATSGEAALASLGQEPADVVVSDMRMPGMSGAELLERVRQTWPHVVRIVLSGQSDEEQVLCTLGPTHQYVTKPCSPDALKAVLSRACSTSSLIPNDFLRDLASSTKALPSVPGLYSELVDVLASDTSSVREVAAVICRDPGMTAKILQLVNSAFFGLPNRVTSSEQAVTILGINLVKALTLSAHVFSHYEPRPTSMLSMDAVWRHSLAVSQAAASIARAEEQLPGPVEDAMVAGLLHDVGMLVIEEHACEQYRETLTAAHRGVAPLVKGEREALGATHAQVGGYLIGLWGIPAAVVDAIAYHHSLADRIEVSFAPLVAVHAAEVLVNEHADLRSVYECDAPDWRHLDRLGLAHRVPVWRAALRNPDGQVGRRC